MKAKKKLHIVLLTFSLVILALFLLVLIVSSGEGSPNTDVDQPQASSDDTTSTIVVIVVLLLLLFSLAYTFATLVTFISKKCKRTVESNTITPLMTPSQYDDFRRREEQLLEKKYDLNTTKGIKSIPLNASIHKGGGVVSYTGDIDYYLQRKSGEYEKNGQLELAIACSKKSNDIRFYCRNGYKRDDYYSLVRLLVRAGRIEEAKKEKAKIDDFFDSRDWDNDSPNCEYANIIKYVLSQARSLSTDLVIMDVHGMSCPECAKYQGRVFSLSGASKKFPKIPDAFWKYGAIHPRCGHSFYPYVDGATNPELGYTLGIQKPVSKDYTHDIVAYSNRPFVDDRPPEDISAAIALQKKQEAELSRQRLKWAQVIEDEIQRCIDKRNFEWCQKNLPEMCPKSLQGYRRMRNLNSKNFIKLKNAAKTKGQDL